VGGSNDGVAEIYNPASNNWSGASDNPEANRAHHTTTLMPDGRVVSIGGTGGVSGIVLYDPRSDSWTPSSQLLNGGSGRANHTATLLPDGRILLAGGEQDATLLASVETYDPSQDAVAAAGSLNTARKFHTATPLSNGNVFIAGGDDGNGPLDKTETSEPGLGAWSQTGSLHTALWGHTATLLADGQVLITGGEQGGFEDGVEIYTPKKKTWRTAHALISPRVYHTATLLPDGRVLAAGGDTYGGMSTAEIFDPKKNSWFDTGWPDYVHGRGATATLLPNGKVLLAGGGDPDGNNVIGDADVYDTAAGTWTATGAMNDTRAFHTATLLPNGKVLVAGGLDTSNTPLDSAELYDPQTEKWSTTGSLNNPRRSHSATLLPDGRVLVAGGDLSNSGLAEIYDPTAKTWSTVSSMNNPRENHAALMLPNGQVLAVGGDDGSLNATAPAEIYDPQHDAWATSSSLNVARFLQTATLLSDGRILVVGGSVDGGYNPTDSTEIAAYTEYDYAAQTSRRPSLNRIDGRSVEPGSPIAVRRNKTISVSGRHLTGSGLANPVNRPKAYLLGAKDGHSIGSFVDLSSSIYQSNFSADNLSVQIPDGLCGHYLFWVQANAIPSAFSVLNVGPGSMSAPSSVVLTDISESSFTIQWAAVPGAEGYFIEASTWANFRDRAVLVSTGPSATWAHVAGLLPNQRYHVRIAAESCGQAGSFRKAMVDSIAPLPPGLTVDTVHVNSIAVSWSAQPARSFNLHLYGMQHDMAVATQTVKGLSSTRTSHRFTHLAPDATYYIAIQAVNAEGVPNPSDWSIWIAAKTPSLIGGIEVARYNLAEARLILSSSKRRGLVRKSTIAVSPLESSARVSIIGQGGILVQDVPVANHQAIWNGADGAGRQARAGTYYILLELDRKKRFLKFTLRP
jgi:N-acetylneuraminic acid mutarotase